MHTSIRFLPWLSLALCLLLSNGFLKPCVGQTNTQLPFVRPIVGSRMIVGNGKIEEYCVKCFLHLCNEPQPKIVLIQLGGNARLTEQFLRQHGAGTVLTLNSIPPDSEKLALALLDANGIWIEGALDGIFENRLLLPLIKNIAQRRGVIAVDSTSVSKLGDFDDNDVSKRIQSPFAKCEFQFGEQNKSEVLASSKARWTIPDSSVLVCHEGRKIAGYGHHDITVKVDSIDGRPSHRGTFECPDVFSPGSYPFYGLDLMSWVRTANEQSRPTFPAKETDPPVVENGTLFLHGGSGVSPSVMREFVKLAGGSKASIVCIPSAQRFAWPDQPDSYSASVLESIGHSRFTTLHTDDPVTADNSKQFAEAFKNATGVWIDGGRTFRFMDCYEGTQVEKLIANVLKRGGVVGGSSAGCQVPSELLVRGNPRSNRELLFSGYTRGMGLLKGVVIDAHFRQRNRQEPFLELMNQYPQMLGIGIDERTALIVTGSKGRVVGDSAVSFYDLSDGAEPTSGSAVLKSGESYDLKLRKKLN